jgi:predicted CoA-binding protein
VPPDPGPSGDAQARPPILDGAAARDVLRTAHRIAVVGASAHAWRASHSVMAYLLKQGYDCVPVNPEVDSVLGRACYPSWEAAAIAHEGGVRVVMDRCTAVDHRALGGPRD